MNSMLSSLVVPIIDLSPWRSNKGRHQVTEEVARACEEIGFFGLVGHGVSQDVIRRADAAARRFFDLPVETKLPVAAHRPDAIRGYVPFKTRAVAYSMGRQSPPDLREVFSLGPIDVDRADPYYFTAQAGNHFAPNVWPADFPELEGALCDYYRALEDLCHVLMQVFATALGKEPEFFEPFIDRHISMLEALNYPSLDAPALPGQLRIGEHSDYGSLTVLLHEEAPGNLQVLTKTGRWVDVPAVDGGFIVNIGDLMAQWTNDRWTSTVHRVTAPPPEQAHDSRRMSLAFFHQPNYDALIECLPDEHPDGAEPKYAPVTSGEYLSRKLDRVRSSRERAEGASRR